MHVKRTMIPSIPLGYASLIMNSEGSTKSIIPSLFFEYNRLTDYFCRCTGSDLNCSSFIFVFCGIMKKLLPFVWYYWTVDNYTKKWKVSLYICLYTSLSLERYNEKIIECKAVASENRKFHKGKICSDFTSQIKKIGIQALFGNHRAFQKWIVTVQLFLLPVLRLNGKESQFWLPSYWNLHYSNGQ